MRRCEKLRINKGVTVCRAPFSYRLAFKTGKAAQPQPDHSGVAAARLFADYILLTTRFILVHIKEIGIVNSPHRIL